MRPINEIIKSVGQEQRPMYTKDEYRKVKVFVASIYQLFTDYRGDFTKDEFFKDECRTWANEIISFSNDDERLMMVKKLVAVSSMRELHGNYRTAKSSLAIACQPMEHLNHDYHIAYPKTGSTGALEEIKRRELEYRTDDVEKAKSHINNLKGIFND